MIKSTHPDFEKLIAGESVVASEALVGFLDEIGLPFVHHNADIRLDNPPELLSESVLSSRLTALLPLALPHSSSDSAKPEGRAGQPPPSFL